MDIQDNNRDLLDGLSPNWGEDTPRGGKAVMNRILKEKATVPLFFAQTLVRSMRDAGYNHTTSALCEHVDNAIQAGASEVRVYFREDGRGPNKKIDVAVYDNGRGMEPPVLKVAMAFGGSMNYGNRDGIARFGMGMKTAALSMSSVLEVYSWRERDAIYTMTLDVDEIGKDRANLVELPEPTLLNELSDEIADLFRKPLSVPSDRSEQELVAPAGTSVAEGIGTSGTIVYMPDCDRLHYAKSKTLVDHATKEMARVYRRALAGGLRLYVNNRAVAAFDPTYSMPNARHTRFLEDVPKASKLMLSKPIDIPVAEGSEISAPATVRIFRLPVEEWSQLPRKTQRNDLRVFDGLTVSILRNDREVFAGSMPNITTRHSVTNWYRIQIDFGGALDEAFGVASNKQGVRLKGYVVDRIKNEIGGDITTLNEELKRVQGQLAAARIPSKPSPSETKAGEADPFQRNSVPALTPEEEAQLDANLRGLALTLKRSNETDDEAFERVRNSRYIIDLRHDDYWPFYDVKSKFGRVVLTINTAHPFFSALYEPLSKMGLAQETETDEAQAPAPQQDGPIVALELLLLSLARTQSRLASTGDEAARLLDEMRREWSDTYRVQMTA